jgi:hypothetical protein
LTIADVAAGPRAGTYFGTGKACPVPVTEATASALGSSWETSSDSSTSSSDDSNSSEELTPPAAPDPAARVKADLRNGLTAEKTVYTDEQSYSSDTYKLMEVETSLDWGGKLGVTVGDAVTSGDKGVVCLWETTGDGGDVYAIADVAAGPNAGTYYGHVPCGDHPSAAIAKLFTSSW